MEINDYLNSDINNYEVLKKLVLFDFVEDTLSGEEKKQYKRIDNRIYKYILYCAHVQDVFNPKKLKSISSPILNRDKTIIENLRDPDRGSELLQEIYRELWIPSCKNKSCAVFCSDTMTSVAERLNNCGGESQKNLLKMFNENKTKYINIIRNFTPLIVLYHTIGNYSVVPRKFNVARSGSYASHDYWDLTLMKIREYYYTKDKRVLEEELLHGKGDVDACRKWLDAYGCGSDGWNNFINQNYMQDYVDNSLEREVISFWQNHSWEQTKIKNEEEEVKEFVKNTCLCILKRGIRIVFRLSKKNVPDEEKIKSCSEKILNDVWEKCEKDKSQILSSNAFNPQLIE